MVSLASSILALALASLATSSGASYSLRASSNTTASGSRKLEIDPDYGFVVSHIREDKDWCLTAAYGATNFEELGFRKCRYEEAPASQLFKFDEYGKLHSALDPSKCMILNHGDALFDGVRIRLAGCELETLLNTFELVAGEFFKVKLPFELSPPYCVSNRGPNPHNGDTIHAKQGCKNRGDYKWSFVTPCGVGSHIMSLGVEATGTSVGGVAVSPFAPDTRPVYSDVVAVPVGTGESLVFDTTMSHRKIGNGWASAWSHGYNGSVYWSKGAKEVTMTLPGCPNVFVFYFQGNLYGEYNFRIQYAGGSIEESILTSGSEDGAKGFAVFYDDCFGFPTGITVSSVGNVNDMAIGEFFIGDTSCGI
jgi:hypothetical protein